MLRIDRAQLPIDRLIGMSTIDVQSLPHHDRSFRKANVQSLMTLEYPLTD